MTDWIKSTWVLNEEGEEEKLTLSELFKQFVGKITDGADVKFVAAELPNFLQKFIQSAQFSEEDWKKTVGDCVMELENYVTDAKYLLHLIITSFIIPVTQTNSLVKLSDVEWIDEETSFDVWPQYAIIASVLDDAIKKKGNGAVSEIISSLQSPLEKLKEHEEDMMVDDLLEWMQENLSAENIELITKSLEIEKKEDD